jgi:hypothetical protein
MRFGACARALRPGRDARGPALRPGGALDARGAGRARVPRNADLRQSQDPTVPGSAGLASTRFRLNSLRSG